METNKLSPGKFASNYGLILGAVMVLISIAMYATDMALEGKQWPIYIYYLIFPTVIIYAINQYKKKNDNLLSLSEAMKTGISIAIISALVYGLYVILFNYVIDPTYNEQILKATEDTLMDSDVPAEMIEKQLEWVKWLSNPILGTAFWLGLSLFFGLIYSLISGLIMKQEE